MKPSARALAAAPLVVLLVVFTGVLEGRSASVDSAIQAAAKSMESKIQILGSKDTRPAASYRAVVITTHEANSYMMVHSGELLPPGVGVPSITVQPEHAVVAGDVDFEKLSRLYPNPNDIGPKILAAMFHGSQHVTITAGIQSENTGVLLRIESVTVGSTTVPKWLVDYIIQNVLQPKYHFDLGKPFPYPDHVTRIVLGSGQVTFLRNPMKRQ